MERGEWGKVKLEGLRGGKGVKSVQYREDVKREVMRVKIRSMKIEQRREWPDEELA